MLMIRALGDDLQSNFASVVAMYIADMIWHADCSIRVY